LANALASVKKFITITVLLIVCASAAIFLFEQQVAEPVKLSTLLRQSIDTAIVIIAGSAIVFLIRRFRNVMVKRIGPQLATIFQLFMMLIAIVITLFTVLDIFQVSAMALLLGGGIVTLVIGLIVSNLVGSTFAGTLILISNAFKVGDNVLVNNVPGRIEEITTMFTRIRNDMGGMIVIPNTALISGSIIVTKMPHDDSAPGSRLPYTLGDRVYTTYLNENGTVKEITPLQTKILLDSGKTITFLNTSVMTGMVAIARIDQTCTVSELKTRKNKPEHAETSSATSNEQRA
jgi:small-conductance mechanosensitive channel